MKAKEVPHPKETIRILNELLRRRIICENQFKSMHHLGDSIEGFLRYCETRGSFQPGGNNARLHERLRAMLEAAGQRVDR